MRHPGRHKQQIAGTERVGFRAVLKLSMATHHHVHLILQVRLLGIQAPRLVYFHRHAAVPEELEEGFTFVGLKPAKRFFNADFHG